MQERSARNPLEERKVKWWRAAARATLVVLLCFAGLQYYFLDVLLTIAQMPSAGVLLPPAPSGLPS